MLDLCCGALREANEDGISTSHAYNSALQELGTTCNQVDDGDMVITPETLVENTVDALGRAVKQTDILSRVTTT